jgi:hypothetical protein
MTKRIIYFALITIALLIVLGVIDVMLITTPAQLRARIAEEIAEQLNADFEVDSIEHSFFSSKVYLTNVRLKSRGQESRVFFTANTAVLSINYFAFLGTPALKSAIFEDPLLTVYRPKEAEKPPVPGQKRNPTPLERLAMSSKRSRLPKFVFHNATLHVYTDESTVAEIGGLNLVIDPTAAGEKNSLRLGYQYGNDRQVQVNLTIDPVTGITRLVASGSEPNYLCMTDELHGMLVKLANGRNNFAADLLDLWDDLGLGGAAKIESFELTYDPSKEESKRYHYQGRLLIEDVALKVKEFPYQVRLVGGELLVNGIDITLEGVQARNEKDSRCTIAGGGTIKDFLSGKSEVDITITAHDVPIDGKLRDALSIYPDIMKIWGDIQPKGIGKTVVMNLRKKSDQRQCRASVAINFDGRAAASYTYADTNGTLRIVEASEVTGDVNLSEGVAEINASGKIAGVTASATNGWIARPGYPDSEMEIEAVTDVFEVNDEILRVLPESTRKEIQDAGVTRNLSLKLRLTKQKDQPSPSFRAEIETHKASIFHKVFPYQFDNIEGTLFYEKNRIWSPPGKDITATHGGAKLEMKISIDGSAPQTKYDLEIRGEKIPLDKDLYNALPPEVRKEIDDYVPPALLEGGEGMADVVCRIKGNAPNPDISVELHVTGASVKCAYFPYLVKDVNGVMRVEPGGVYLDQVRGTHGGARFSLDDGKIEKDLVDVTINGKAVAFDDDVRAALNADFVKIYDSLKPAGAVDALVRLTSKGGAKIRPEVKIIANKTMEFTYSAFPLPAKDVEAEVAITPDNVRISKLGCKLGSLAIPYDEQQNYCEISLGKDPRFFLHLGKVEGVRINDELKGAFPKGLRDSLNRMGVRGDMDLSNMELDFLMGENRGRYSYKFDAALKNCSVGEKPAIDKLNGLMKIQVVEIPGEQANMEGTSVENLDFYFRGVHITNVSGKVTRLDAKDVDFAKPADPHRVDFTAAAYNGGGAPNITDGYFIFCLGDSKEYKGGFTFSSVDLTALHSELTQKESKLAGKMSGRVDFRGEGEDFSTLQGAGNLDIAEGNLGELPLIYSLNQLLQIDLPEKQIVNRGSLTFNIKDKAFNFDVMKFNSQAVEFVGYGKVDFDENLDMVIFSNTVLKGIPVVEQIFRWFKKQLYPVQIKGTFAKPEVSPKVFNLITDIPLEIRKLLGGGD